MVADSFPSPTSPLPSPQPEATTIGVSSRNKIKQDEALEIIDSTDGVARLVTAEEDARVLKKIDRYILPIMFVIYFLQYTDKQTLSFASVFGIIRDTNLVGNQYSLLGSIVYIAQLLFQPLSAYFLVKFRLSIYIPLIVTCWGITLACMSAARTFMGLLIARFLLGAFEASVQGAFILVGQIWYRRHEQGFRVAVWYSNNGWGNIFGSLIMYGIGHIRSGVLFRYQIIFLLLGCITSIVGILSFFIFPDNPVKCKFLSHEDKIVAVERLRANQQGLETKTFKPNQVLEMILDIKSWCWMILMFLISIPVSGILVFGPLILKGFGFDGFNVMLCNIPFGVLQVSAIFGAFWAARRFRTKSLVLLISLMLCIAGTAALLFLGRAPADLPGLLTAYYVLASNSAVIPLILNWQSSNVAGHTKKTTTTAFMIMGGVGGGIVGPFLFAPKDKPHYTRGLKAMLVSFSSCFILTCLTAMYLRYLNMQNKKRRIRSGKRAEIVDFSMLSAKEAEAARAKALVEKDATISSEVPNVENGGPQVEDVGKRAFEDVTDLQNEEFIYVY